MIRKRKIVLKNDYIHHIIDVYVSLRPERKHIP